MNTHLKWSVSTASLAAVALSTVCPGEAANAQVTMATRYQQADQLAVSLDGAVVKTLPCQRVALEYPPGVRCPRPRVQVNMARTSDGNLWAAVYGEIFESPDAGSTWKLAAQIANSNGVMTFTILRDDTFLAGQYVEEGESYGQDFVIVRSTDRGKTWQRHGVIPPYPFDYVGSDTSCMVELSSGRLVMPLRRATRDWSSWMHEVWHSGDGGRTWSSVPYFDGAESHILELEPGRLLGSIRRSRYQRWAYDPPGMAMVRQNVSDHTHGAHGTDTPPKAYKLMTDSELASQPGHAYKGISIANSENDGISWHSLRPVVDDKDVGVLAYNEVHGQLGKLPDGRIVLVHSHRPVPGDPVGYETVARVSHDEGKTWDRHAYHVAAGQAWPSCLVLNDGTIVVVTAGPAAIRFKLTDKE